MTTERSRHAHDQAHSDGKAVDDRLDRDVSRGIMMSAFGAFVSAFLGGIMVYGGDIALGIAMLLLVNAYTYQISSLRTLRGIDRVIRQ